MKKRLNEVRKQNDTIYIKTGKLDKKLLRETNDILKRLKVASRNPERYGK
jgi:transcription initiation factor IIE alpha subunit